jgi:quinol monooxygenase YgiN
MDEIGFFVELAIDPKQCERFDAFMRQHAKATLAGEEGCLAFEVYVHVDSPDRYVLYERYADGAALDTHKTSAQLAKHRGEVDPLILSRRIFMQGEEVDASQFPGAEA